MATKLLAYIVKDGALPTIVYGLTDNTVQTNYNNALASWNGTTANLDPGTGVPISVTWAGIYKPFKLTGTGFFTPQGSVLLSSFGTGVAPTGIGWKLVELGSPAVHSDTAVHAAITLPATGTTIVTTGITNPDIGRVARIKGNASGIAGNVVVAGSYKGLTCSDTIALSGSSSVDGTTVFDTITSITVPAKTNVSGDTVSVGFGDALAIGAALSRNTVDMSQCTNNGVQETAAPTVVINATDITKNTVTLGSTLAGNPVYIGYSS